MSLVAIFGTTGVGKSNLAIQLARALSPPARIINADAMQVYAGLDVLTNKVPEHDRHGVDHLLLGFKQPGEQYVVGQWVADAVRAIDETHRRGQIPILVGGTSYWMQHLMFPDRLAGMQPERAPTLSESIAAALASLPPPLLELYNSLPPQPPDAAIDPDAASTLHRLLLNLDPDMAARWHWRDTRKVLRSLRIVKDTGRRPSEILIEQSGTLLRPRYRTLCFWLYAEPPVLNPRLNVRVDEMMQNGLLDEVRSLHGRVSSGSADYTLGIYQSIGYKEFHGYLSAPSQTDEALNEAMENMKSSTRQYAKRQLSWIRNKLLPAIHATNARELTVPTYLLDATDIGEAWMSNVRDPALQITRDFLNASSLPDPRTLSSNARTMLDVAPKPIDPTLILQAQRKVVCAICTADAAQPFMIYESERAAHLRARSHRRLAKKLSPEQHREANRKRQVLKAAVESSSESDVDPHGLFETA
ncbi:tRNA isopentenyltransferase [Mycena belliarum]|uniref:tRNA isopentenyltransferase n=1 Tax=Mycena belliarum TaxID=1033014 RepID=A0AAD6XL91_9AGAR|nr:tRNA isopentenyltransferase [Mycena belliae]